MRTLRITGRKWNASTLLLREWTLTCASKPLWTVSPFHNGSKCGWKRSFGCRIAKKPILVCRTNFLKSKNCWSKWSRRWRRWKWYSTWQRRRRAKNGDKSRKQQSESLQVRKASGRNEDSNNMDADDDKLSDVPQGPRCQLINASTFKVYNGLEAFPRKKRGIENFNGVASSWIREMCIQRSDPWARARAFDATCSWRATRITRDGTHEGFHSLLFELHHQYCAGDHATNIFITRSRRLQSTNDQKHLTSLKYHSTVIRTLYIALLNAASHTVSCPSKYRISRNSRTK